LLLLGAAACASGGGYARAELIYAEPPLREYDVPVESVVIVCREVFVTRGYVVYRVERHGPDRIIWARRGDHEVVRVFVTPHGTRAAIRSVQELRDRGRHRGWVRHGPPPAIIAEFDVRLASPVRRR
jgi:hypothetical protein